MQVVSADIMQFSNQRSTTIPLHHSRPNSTMLVYGLYKSVDPVLLQDFLKQFGKTKKQK